MYTLYDRGPELSKSENISKQTLGGGQTFKLK